MNANPAALIRPEIMKAHRASWWAVYETAGVRERVRLGHLRRVRRFDVTCSCGWDSHTGGGTRSYVAFELWNHRWSEQDEIDRQTEAVTPPPTGSEESPQYPGPHGDGTVDPNPGAQAVRR